MAFWRQFGGCTTTFGDLCWPAGLEATRLTYGANLHNHPRLTVREPLHPALGPQSGRDQRPPVAADPRRAGTGRARRRDRPSPDRLDRCRGCPPAAAAGHRRGARARHGARHRRRRPRTTRRSSTRMRTDSTEYRQRLADFPLERVASITGLDAGGDPRPGAGLRPHEARAAHRRLRPAAPFPRRPDDEGRGAAAGADRQCRRGRAAGGNTPISPATACDRSAAAGTRRPRDQFPCRRWPGTSRRSTVRRFARRGSSAATRPRRTRHRIASATALARARSGRRGRSVHDADRRAGAFRAAGEDALRRRGPRHRVLASVPAVAREDPRPAGRREARDRDLAGACASASGTTRATSPTTARRSCRRCCRKAARPRWTT